MIATRKPAVGWWPDLEGAQAGVAHVRPRTGLRERGNVRRSEDLRAVSPGHRWGHLKMGFRRRYLLTVWYEISSVVLRPSFHNPLISGLPKPRQHFNRFGDPNRCPKHEGRMAVRVPRWLCWLTDDPASTIHSTHSAYCARPQRSCAARHA